MYWLFVFGGLYRSIEPIRLRIANKGLNSKNLSYAICLRILLSYDFFFIIAFLHCLVCTFRILLSLRSVAPTALILLWSCIFSHLSLIYFLANNLTTCFLFCDNGEECTMLISWI